jgi:hypothetical protein
VPRPKTIHISSVIYNTSLSARNWHPSLMKIYKYHSVRIKNKKRKQQSHMMVDLLNREFNQNHKFRMHLATFPKMFYIQIIIENKFARQGIS